MRRIGLAVLLLLVIATAGTSSELKFSVVGEEAVRQRLMTLPAGIEARQRRVEELFREAGCKDANLTEQPVTKKLANVVCVLPGATPYTYIVGAHYDYVTAGQGIVDNWSGASLLPSLYQALAVAPRQHTFIFVAFTQEEVGEVGSQTYVKKMTAEQRDNLRGMINLDTLGLGPTEVWYTHADPYLMADLSTTAASLRSPIRAMSVDQVGSSDSEQFRIAGMPALTLHSLTTATFPILHNAKDAPDKISFADYYESYRLISGYLAKLDGAAEPVWRVGKNVSAPHPLTTPALEKARLTPELQKLVKHPEAASVVVGADGHVSDVEVTQIDDVQLIPIVEETLRQWTFKPGTKDGAPVPTRIDVKLELHH